MAHIVSTIAWNLSTAIACAPSHIGICLARRYRRTGTQKKKRPPRRGLAHVPNTGLNACPSTCLDACLKRTSRRAS